MISRATSCLRLLPALLACLACLAGCAPEDDGGLALMHAPLPEGKARVVLYYPGKFIGSDGRLQIVFDTVKSCQLNSESYLVKDVPAGEKNIAISFCGMPKISYVKLIAVAGERYYIRILPYDSSVTGILSGYPGESVPETQPFVPRQAATHNQPVIPAPPAADHKGPFLIERVDEAAALEVLSSMHFSKDTGH